MSAKQQEKVRTLCRALCDGSGLFQVSDERIADAVREVSVSREDWLPLELATLAHGLIRRRRDYPKARLIC